METEFLLGPNKALYQIYDNFPKLEEGSKVGVFFSGGLESTLIAYIASKLYKPENVMLFYSDSMFSGNNAIIDQNIRANVARTADVIGKDAIYIETDLELLNNDRKTFVESYTKQIINDYKLEIMFFGFTSLFFEVEPFKDETLTLKEIIATAYSNQTLYKDTIREFHLDTGAYASYLQEIDIPSEVYPILRGASNMIVSPFKDLNKKEVIDLYAKLGLLPISYQTSSCIMDELRETGKHCGKCFNCQQRLDGYMMAGYLDRTPYANTDIFQRYDELMKARHGFYNED
jgi:7-cyano-7-deazaguanine synthase in queuosine biosynthesis